LKSGLWDWHAIEGGEGEGHGREEERGMWDYVRGDRERGDSLSLQVYMKKSN
jgi:hypothetical protein